MGTTPDPQPANVVSADRSQFVPYEKMKIITSLS